MITHIVDNVLNSDPIGFLKKFRMNNNNTFS